MCKGPAQDAHHIIERRLFDDEGYYLDNGASLCAAHHIEAEKTLLSCEAIREKAGITKIVLPNTFDGDEKYDKWGNIILPNGTRVKGELFWDESVSKILTDVMDQFTEYVKYPKIFHLPWSKGIDVRTDRVLSQDQLMEYFEDKEVVVTEKIDGENTSIYNDYMHARSLDGRNHVSRNWLKNASALWRYEIPNGWRVCGENVYAEHSIHYKGLGTYFFVFGIYNEKNMGLSWSEVEEYTNLLGLRTVPVLYSGIYDEDLTRQLYSGKSVFPESLQEGYVMRLASQIQWSQHRYSYAKFVREGHVQTNQNWMNRAVVKNEL
jgi:hypothetical protein